MNWLLNSLAFLGLIFTTSPGFAGKTAAPGPWGPLTYTELFLEAPQEVIRMMPAPSEQTVWKFPGMGFDEVAGVLEDLAEDPGLSTRMKKEIPLQSLENETRAFPSAAIIRALPDSLRIEIYRLLSRYEENPHHHRPVIIDSQNLQEWFPKGRLPEMALTLIDELSTPVGDSLAFSDLPLLLSTVETAQQELALRRALTRTKSMLLELNISPGDDMDAITDYWTLDKTAKSALPLFESFQRIEGDVSFDITDILPIVPRKVSNTFPGSAEGLSGSYPNSFWSAFNFFAIEPEEKYLRKTAAIKQLHEKYEEVEPPLRFGDIITFVEPVRNQVLHTCNYIADDIAFTKNGKSVLAPWVFMKIEDIRSRFSFRKVPNLHYWRRLPNQVKQPQVSN